jgi:adenine-specific DNA-methyltransferase
MKKEKPIIERVERESARLLVEHAAKLKTLFPEAVTEGKIDFDRLRTTLGDEIDDRPERYSFNWAGKEGRDPYAPDSQPRNPYPGARRIGQF